VEPVTHTVELAGGYKDKKEVVHRAVAFAHRITAKDLFALDEDPRATIPTQYNDLLLSRAITKFGELKIPIAATVLLDLDSVDREDLVEGHNVFSALSAEGHNAEFLPDHNVRLGWGFKINGLEYRRVAFGRRVTGRDEVDADRAGLKPGVRRLCFLIGRQIQKISTQDSSSEIDGPVSLSEFESLDGADVATLRGAAELWRQSFRIRGAEVS
jgi:phage FluMu protein gp41